jgi:hypothetical protein
MGKDAAGLTNGERRGRIDQWGDVEGKIDQWGKMRKYSPMGRGKGRLTNGKDAAGLTMTNREMYRED